MAGQKIPQRSLLNKNNKGDLCYEAVASISDKLPQWGVNAASPIHDSLSVSFWTAEMSPSLRLLSAAHWTCHYQIIAPRSSVCSSWMRKWQICCGRETQQTLSLRIQLWRNAQNFLSQLKNTSATCFSFHANTKTENLHKPQHIVTRAHCWLRLHQQHRHLRAQKEVREEREFCISVGKTVPRKGYYSSMAC